MKISFRLLLLLVPLVATVSPALAKPTACGDGRFVAPASILPGAGSADGAFDAVVFAKGRISIESGCPAVRAKLKGRKDGSTVVKAQWKKCGDLKKVRLSGRIVPDGDQTCARLTGTLKAKKQPATQVNATKTRCGDSIVDKGAGEACDPPGGACNDQCQTSGVITAPARTWTWIPFTDAFCANGTPTGIGINPGNANGRLVIFLNGGGACWDESTCYSLKTATYIEGGYGPTEFAGDTATLLQLSFFNRNDAANPFKDDNLIFVPYCTGDVHAGSILQNYGGKATHHVGFQNVAAYLKRIVPTFPDVSRVILSGSSAGGFGALTNWNQTQEAFGAKRVDLIDDSGPPLPSPYLTDQLEATWRNAWNLAAAIPASCPACANDLDAVIAFYGTTMTGHRAALLSYTQDSVISLFFQIPGTQVEMGLGALKAEMAPYDIWRHFFVTGTTHTVFGTPEVSQGGVSVRQFITQMVTDDPNWVSIEP